MKCSRPAFWCKLKNCLLLKFAANFLAFLGFFAAKMLKMAILTSVWSAQHPKAGQNIQHSTPQIWITLFWDKTYPLLFRTNMLFLNLFQVYKATKSS